MLCSSEVTMQPVSSAAFLTSSPSSGLMVCMSMTRTETPSAAIISRAFSAIWTMRPVAMTVTSLPSFSVTPLSSSNR